MSTEASTLTIDVRNLAPRQRHALVSSTFSKLGTSEAMELVNDHDPRLLYYWLDEQLPGGVAWSYLQIGPEVWRVRISKRAGHDSGQCCGACGGA